MKKLAILFTVLLSAIIACKKTSNSYTPDCTGAAKSFSADVSSLVSSNCASGGCHASGSSNGPGALTSYTEISGSKSSIRSSILNGTMPKGSTLTAAQKNNIICWIDAGALNN